MKRFPDMTIPDEPLTVVQRVYAKGEPLGGNICPPVGPLLFTLLCTLKKSVTFRIPSKMPVSPSLEQCAVSTCL